MNPKNVFEEVSSLKYVFELLKVTQIKLIINLMNMPMRSYFLLIWYKQNGNMIKFTHMIIT